MGDTDSDLLRLALPCTRDAPCIARDALAALDAVAPVRDDARLIASELVTSAVVHAGCATKQTLEMTARLHGDSLVIRVEDGPAEEPAGGHKEEEESTRAAFAARVLEAVARRCGVERPGRYAAWAEIALSR